ncbi:MAG: DUF2764 domain-containing protein [Tannerella sp.]|jgi:hypothetical protein|nr:DUF2764 domain-containing protein [Tannerella sp.]
MSSEYYYLVAGLPNISAEDSKLPYTLLAFREEVESQLSETDRALLRLLFLKFDNRNLLELIRHSDAQPDPKGNFSPDELDELLRDPEQPPAEGRKYVIPDYMKTFVQICRAEDEKDEPGAVAWEDRLATLYYGYAMQCGNAFVADWFELNLDIGNFLTAVTCRKYGLNRADFIVGDSEYAQLFRTSGARDFGLGDTWEYLPAVQRIAEEPDLLTRERKIDRLKWDWLEEHTVFKTFTVESLLAWLLKLEMIERWTTLDRAAGERAFRQVIGAMKTGSNHALEEFKRNSKNAHYKSESI